MDEKLFLIYVHIVGTDHKGVMMCEFLFSDTLEDIDGEGWDTYPAAGQPQPPLEKFIKKVGRLTTSEIKFDVIQESDKFAVWDSVDGIIALAWQNLDDYEEYPEEKRLSFHFGDTLKKVEETLYSDHDLILEYKEANGQKN